MKNTLVFFFLTMVFSCAMESVPTGGDTDILPPEVVKTIPQNFTKNFSAEQIVLEFDEYVELKSFSQQFSISPPLNTKVDHSLKGKKLYININDTLANNTTYTLSFGNSIVDITEGNAQTTFKYVFSTGDIIDSLSVQGHVHNALRGNPVEGVLAMLYPNGSADSAAYLNKPLYYSTTLEDGSFRIDNIAEDNYHLVLVDDKNFDFKLSGKGEKLGFVKNKVNSLLDTVYDISLFRETNDLKFVQAKHSAFGKTEIYYSAPLPSTTEFTNANNSPLWVDFTESRDTFNIWFEENGDDSLVIFANYAHIIDTLFIRLSEKDKPEVKFTELEKRVSPTDLMTLKCNFPLLKLDQKKWLFVDNQDTIASPGVRILQNKHEVEIDFVPQQGHKYKAHFYAGFTETFFNDYNDTQALEFTTKLERDYAFYLLDIRRKSNKQSIVQLLDEKGNLLREYVIIGSEKIDMPYLTPATYLVRLIEDENRNGMWDTGDFLEKRQPEKVFYFSDVIELRANWEIENIWELD